MTSSLPESLLVVEDSNADFRFLKRLLKKMDVKAPIHRADTGDEALQRLYGLGPYKVDSKVSRPSIIMLDLNLPGTDGREVLVKLKQDNEFATIPIIVFTTSSAPSDIEFCYQNGANGYMIKPLDIQALTDKVQAFVDYWLGANTPPSFLMN